jgi:hypothetical protein
MNELGKCRGCGRPIRWVRTARTGTPQPIDPDPSADGNLELIGRSEDGYTICRVVPLIERDELLAAGHALYMPHHATCPEVGRFR